MVKNVLLVVVGAFFLVMLTGCAETWREVANMPHAFASDMRSADTTINVLGREYGKGTVPPMYDSAPPEVSVMTYESRSSYDSRYRNGKNGGTYYDRSQEYTKETYIPSSGPGYEEWTYNANLGAGAGSVRDSGLANPNNAYYRRDSK